jgi:hypothetical protein
MIELILDFLFTPMIDGVTIAPAWWAPLAISAGVGLGKKLLGGGKQRELNREAGQTKRRRDEAIEGTSDALGRIGDRADAVKEDYTVQDLYGPIISQLTDRTQADTDQAEMNTFRAMLAGGGDMAGTGANLVNQITESGQANIQNIVAQFAEATTGRNLQESVRKDRLLGNEASGYAGLSQLLSGIASDDQMLALQKGQADNQFGLDMLGIGSQVASSLLSS